MRRKNDWDNMLLSGMERSLLLKIFPSHKLEVSRYIHRNPLRAGMVSNLKDFAWSRHHGYISGAKKWEWLYKDFLLFILSGKKSRSRSAYIDFVSHVEPVEIERFYSLKNLPSVLGSNSFKEWVKEKFSYLRFQKEIPESRELTPSPENIIATVCSYFEIKKEKIAASKRGTENLPRDIVIYLVRLHCRDTLSNIGRYFGIGHYSTVSSAVERIKSRKNQDRSLQRRLVKIEEKFNKGQRQT